MPVNNIKTYTQHTVHNMLILLYVFYQAVLYIYIITILINP